MTKVSILIPTKNRGERLKFAVQSALNQDYKNIEIVISNNNSDDNTEKIVQSFKDKRIIYIKSEKSLSMIDNWELALNNSTGDYILYLTDTSFLFPFAISQAFKHLNDNKLQLAVWRSGFFIYKNWIEPARRNNLYIPKSTNKVSVIDSKNILKECYNSLFPCPDAMPRPLNSTFCHRSIIEKIKSIHGRLCISTIPDYSSGIAMLFNTEKYLFIDKILSLGSVSRDNNGANAGFLFGNKFKTFLKELNMPFDKIAFWGIPLDPLLVIMVFQDVKKKYPEYNLEINYKNLIYTAVEGFTKIKVYGGNQEVKKYKKIFNEKMKRQKIRLKIAAFIYSIMSSLKWRIIKITRSYSFLHPIEKLRGLKIFYGDKLNFSNVQEAAIKYNEIESNYNEEIKK